MEQISEDVDWNCNKAKLKKLILSQRSNVTFYCGGMSNTDDIWDIFDSVIVLTVSDETTISRLSTRKSGEFGSTKVNRDWVLSWKHDLEARWIKKGCIVINAEANPEEVVRSIVNSIS